MFISLAFSTRKSRNLICPHSSICNNIYTTMKSFGNYPNSGETRIVLPWNDAVLDVHIISSTEHSVTIKVSHKRLSVSLNATVVYGANQRDLREQLWSEQCAVSLSMPDQETWLLFGDKNIVKHEKEKKGALALIRAIKTLISNNCRDRLDIFYLPYKGWLLLYLEQAWEWLNFH